MNPPKIQQENKQNFAVPTKKRHDQYVEKERKIESEHRNWFYKEYRTNQRIRESLQ